MKITNEVKYAVLDQVSSGKTQQRVADNLKLSQKSVSNICKAEERKQAAARQRTAKAREIKKALKDDQSVVVGDFREVSNSVKPGTYGILRAARGSAGKLGQLQTVVNRFNDRLSRKLIKVCNDNPRTKPRVSVIPRQDTKQLVSK